MKNTERHTEWFYLNEEQVDNFIEACNQTDCNFIKYEDGKVYVAYRTATSMFYLGRHLEMIGQIKKLLAK